MTTALTPADCDLQDFPFMPLHVARLRDSDLAAEAHPEACWYAVMLWSASWHQLPAASLPDNETVLARLCGLGRDLKTFRKHRADAMRGFILCDDGRLYHPVVAEQANAAWESKRQQRWRAELARIKKQNQRNGTNLPSPTYEEFVASLSPRTSEDVPRDTTKCPPGQSLQETETGTEISKNTVPNGTGAEAPSDDLAELRSLPIAKGSWRLALKVLIERGEVPEPKARNLVGKWVRDGGLSHDELWKIAEQAWTVGTEDPVPYIAKAVTSAAENRTVGITRPSEERQRAWMVEWQDKPNWWNAGDRGPRPGQEGCRVSPEIQREFGVEPFGAKAAA